MARPTEVMDEFIPAVSMVMPMPEVWVVTPCMVTAMAGLRSVDLDKGVRKLHPESSVWCLDAQIKEQKEHVQIGVSIVDAKISNLRVCHPQWQEFQKLKTGTTGSPIKSASVATQHQTVPFFRHMFPATCLCHVTQKGSELPEGHEPSGGS